MTNNQSVLAVAYSVARASGTHSPRDFKLGRGESSGKAGPPKPTARQAACVYPAGCSFAWAIRGAQQTGPPKDRAELNNDLFVTRMGPQKDLFGTPFGPLFPIQTDAKYPNLPEIRRNLPRGAGVYIKKGVPRRTGSWRRAATRDCGGAFAASPPPDGPEPRRETLLLVPGTVVCRPIAGASVTGSPQPCDTPEFRALPGSAKNDPSQQRIPKV